MWAPTRTGTWWEPGQARGGSGSRGLFVVEAGREGQLSCQRCGDTVLEGRSCLTPQRLCHGQCHAAPTGLG